MKNEFQNIIEETMRAYWCVVCSNKHNDTSLIGKKHKKYKGKIPKDYVNKMLKQVKSEDKKRGLEDY